MTSGDTNIQKRVIIHISLPLQVLIPEFSCFFFIDDQSLLAARQSKIGLITWSNYSPIFFLISDGPNPASKALWHLNSSLLKPMTNEVRSAQSLPPRPSGEPTRPLLEASFFKLALEKRNRGNKP